jgi:hypothetical protein
MRRPHIIIIMRRPHIVMRRPHIIMRRPLIMRRPHIIIIMRRPHIIIIIIITSSSSCMYAGARRRATDEYAAALSRLQSAAAEVAQMWGELGPGTGRGDGAPEHAGANDTPRGAQLQATFQAHVESAVTALSGTVLGAGGAAPAAAPHEAHGTVVVQRGESTAAMLGLIGSGGDIGVAEVDALRQLEGMVEKRMAAATRQHAQQP